MEIDAKLYDQIRNAERAARDAHDRSYETGASFFTRIALGRAQSILMTLVVRYAGADKINK